MKKVLVLYSSNKVRSLFVDFVRRTELFDLVHDVDLAKNAIGLINLNKYNLIITDDNLSSLVFAYWVRRNDKEVIIISIANEERDLNKFGINKCFVKPIVYSKFFKYIKDNC